MKSRSGRGGSRNQGSPGGHDADRDGDQWGVRRAFVSADDPVYANLLLWTDRNHNGIGEPSELRPASELLTEIGHGYQPSGRRDQFGNEFRFQGWARERTGQGRNRTKSEPEENERRRPIWDVFFKLAQWHPVDYIEAWHFVVLLFCEVHVSDGD